MIKNMYPARDLRSLTDGKEIVKAVSREPLAEVLKYWHSLEDLSYYSYFNKGIELAVRKNRYPLYQLEAILAYPEFVPAVLNGLKFLWVNLEFSLTYGDHSPHLQIGKSGIIMKIDQNERLKLLELLPKEKVEVIVDKIAYQLPVILAKSAQDILALIQTLQGQTLRREKAIQPLQ